MFAREEAWWFDRDDEGVNTSWGWKSFPKDERFLPPTGLLVNEYDARLMSATTVVCFEWWGGGLRTCLLVDV